MAKVGGAETFQLRAAPKPLWVCVVQSKGIGVIQGMRDNVTLSCGELAFMFVQDELTITGNQAFEQCIVALNEAPDWLRALDLQSGTAQLHGRANSHLLVTGLVERLVDQNSPPDVESVRAISEALLCLMSMALREGNVPQRLHGDKLKGITRDSIAKYIERHLADPELSVEFLEARLGWSKRTLYRAFSVSGNTESLGRYIWRRRIERAAEVLRSGEVATLTHIAYSFGFSSSSHFSRLFKQYTKVAPLRYRQFYSIARGSSV